MKPFATYSMHAEIQMCQRMLLLGIKVRYLTLRLVLDVPNINGEFEEMRLECKPR